MSVNDFSAVLDDALKTLGLNAEPRQIATLRRHFDLLIEANARVNLTRITDPNEAAVRLYADSAAILAWARREQVGVETVLDVGTGAGFPAVVLAVLAPGWRVTALEATGKKVAFVERAARTLGIDNLRAVQAHSDHWSTEARFDLLTFKAIGPLDECLKTAGRFVADGGHVAVFKTADLSSAEIGAGRRAALRLGFGSADRFNYELPGPQGPSTFSLHVYARSGAGSRP